MWRTQIHGLFSLVTDSGQKIALEKLAERIQYSASDMRGAANSIDAKIQSSINSLCDEITVGQVTSDQVAASIDETTRLIEHREQILKSLRNKA